MIFDNQEQIIPIGKTSFDVEWGTYDGKGICSAYSGIARSYSGSSVNLGVAGMHLNGARCDGANAICGSHDLYYDAGRNTIGTLWSIYSLPLIGVYAAFPDRMSTTNLVQFYPIYSCDYDSRRRNSGHGTYKADKLNYDWESEFPAVEWGPYVSAAHDADFCNRTYTLKSGIGAKSARLYARSYMIFLMRNFDTSVSLDDVNCGFCLWSGGVPIVPGTWGTGTMADPKLFIGFQYKLVRSHSFTINGTRYAYLFAKSPNINVYDYIGGVSPSDLRGITAPMLTISNQNQFCDGLYLLESGYEYVWDV